MSHPFWIIQNVVGMATTVHIDQPIVNLLNQEGYDVRLLHDDVRPCRTHASDGAVWQTFIGRRVCLVHFLVSLRTVWGERDFLSLRKSHSDIRPRRQPKARQVWTLLRCCGGSSRERAKYDSHCE